MSNLPCSGDDELDQSTVGFPSVAVHQGSNGAPPADGYVPQAPLLFPVGDAHASEAPTVAKPSAQGKEEGLAARTVVVTYFVAPGFTRTAAKEQRAANGVLCATCNSTASFRVSRDSRVGDLVDGVTRGLTIVRFYDETCVGGPESGVTLRLSATELQGTVGALVAPHDVGDDEFYEDIGLIVTPLQA